MLVVVGLVLAPLLPGHYVTRWAQFFSSALRVSPVPSRPVLRPRVQSVKLLLSSSSSTPRPPAHTTVYIKPSAFGPPLFLDIFNSLIQLSSQPVLLPSLSPCLPLSLLPSIPPSPSRSPTVSYKWGSLLRGLLRCFSLCQLFLVNVWCLYDTKPANWNGEIYK